MKKFIYIILAFLIVGYSSCDIVEAPFHDPIDPGDTIPDTIPTLVKRVLLEDYTGHTCVYCAGAAVEAEHLKEQMGDRLVVMAVHAGYFAEPVPGDPYLSADFRTVAGESWNSFFSIAGNPVGIIDRNGSSGSYLVPVGQWESRINAELNLEPEAEVTIENSFNEGTKKLTTTISTRFVSNTDSPMRLLVCITQDSIIDGQKNNDPLVGETPLIEEYVFMHMLRGNLNGTWGESLTEEYPLLSDEVYEKTYDKVFPADWIPKNCHVVAFVYNNENKYIMQVNEAAVLDE